MAFSGDFHPGCGEVHAEEHKVAPRETGEQRVQVSDIPTRGQNPAAKELLVGLASPIDDRRQVASASETRSRTSWPVVWAVMVGLWRLTAGWAVEGAAGSGVFRKNAAYIKQLR